MASAKWQILIVCIVAIGGSLLYFYFDPVRYTNFFPKCLFHELTHLYCPGCGSQRAIAALLHGDFWKAVDFNFLFVASLPLIGFSASVFTWNSFSKRKIQQAIFYSSKFAKIFLVVVLLFWILRNIPVSPFNWLAP